jgi:hypothetical protein
MSSESSKDKAYIALQCKTQAAIDGLLHGESEGRRYAFGTGDIELALLTATQALRMWLRNPSKYHQEYAPMNFVEFVKAFCKCRKLEFPQDKPVAYPEERVMGILAAELNRSANERANYVARVAAARQRESAMRERVANAKRAHQRMLSAAILAKTRA